MEMANFETESTEHFDEEFEDSRCPPPVCFKSPLFRSVMETSSFCMSCGSFGLRGTSASTPRRWIMNATTVLSLIGCVFQLVTVIALSTSASVIKALPFSYGVGTCAVDGMCKEDLLELHSGVQGAVLTVHSSQSGAIERSFYWGDANCLRLPDAGAQQPPHVQELCDDCKAVSLATLALCIVSFVVSLPQICVDLARASILDDLNFHKCSGMLFGILGFASTLGTLSAYAYGCYKNLPYSLHGLVFEWRPGPPLILLFLATLLKIPDLVVHFLVPTPAARHDPLYLGLEPNPYFQTGSFGTESRARAKSSYDSMDFSGEDPPWPACCKCFGKMGREPSGPTHMGITAYPTPTPSELEGFPA